MTTETRKELIETFTGAFMQPEFYQGEMIHIVDKYGDEITVPIEYYSEYMGEIDETHNAWYFRLSASGYMDCTDWSGPYDSELEAMEQCLILYGE